MKSILTVIYCFFLFISSFSYARDPDSDPDGPYSNPKSWAEQSSWDCNSDYSSMMCGCVSAISGDYMESTVDMIVPAPEPIIFERLYNSSCTKVGSIGYGWHHNHNSYVELVVEGPDEIYYPEKCRFSACYHERSGALAIYGDDTSHYEDVPSMLKLNLSRSGSGVTNCSQCLSGRTNIKNNLVKVFGAKSPRMISIQDGAGKVMLFGKEVLYAYPGAHDLYYISSEVNANLNRLDYSYGMENQTKRRSGVPVLQKISSMNPTGEFEYGTLTSLPFTLPVLKKHYRQIIGSNDKKVSYEFKYHKKHKNCLSRVLRDDIIAAEYEYDSYRVSKYSSAYTVHKKKTPHGSYLDIKYYEYSPKDTEGKLTLDLNDYRIGRVRSLAAPVGATNEPVEIAKITYQAHVEKKDGHEVVLEGSTNLYDAYNHLKVYQYSKEHRLTSIIKHKGTTNHQPYSTQVFNWGMPGTNEETQLISQSLKDVYDNFYWHRVYTYDAHGNVVQDTLYGNLTGNAYPAFSLVYGISLSKTESYQKNYTYTNDRFNLMLSASEGDVKTCYRYLHDTDYLWHKLIYKGDQIKERQFYDYDSYGILSLEITDDGIAENREDLSGVTQRLIRRVKSTTTAPFGLPEEVTEAYLDMASGQEVLIKKTINSHSKYGYLIHQDIYDSNGEKAYSLSFEYDLRGNLILERKANGDEIIKEYDQRDRLISLKGPHPDYCKNFTYDYADRLIRTDEYHSNHQHLVETNKYNFLGNRISSTDRYGHETHYIYDDFGRVIETHLPPVPDENGVLQQPIATVEYSILGRPTVARDAKGFTIRTEYTIRGEPCKIYYADGTFESKEYNPKGTLRRSVDRDGTEKQFTYDYKDRLIKTETYAPTGELLSTSSSTYDAFRLLSEMDNAGNITEYHYDGAGRLIEKKKVDQRQRFQYDSLGRLIKTYEYFGAHAEDFRCFFQKHDLLDRVIEEGIEDSQGNILRVQYYTYDPHGNRTQVIQGDGAVTRMVYDSRGFIVELIDPLGNTTYSTYDETYCNEHGQHVLQICTTDPMGNRAEVIHDSHGRPYLFFRRDAFGALISKRELRYDLVDNVIHTLETILNADKGNVEVQRTSEYDCLRRVVTMTEAVGTAEQRITHYSYYKNGKKAATMKPDGNTVSYGYDFLGRVIVCEDSAHTFSYRYHYDANHNLICIDDTINNTTTLRTFNQYDQLTHEKLANGLALEYEYDLVGRPQKVTFPDKSSIKYQYDAYFLRTITRDGAEVYQHQYDTYDSLGNVVKVSLIGKAGTVAYRYDSLSRLISQESLHYSLNNITYDPAGNLTQYTCMDAIATEPVSCSFTYDANYQLATEQGFCSHQYTHDSLFNRISKDNEPYTLNFLNQILHHNHCDYQYDPNGNIISKSTPESTIRYEYDGLDRLVKVVQRDHTIHYVYDALNRRISKKIDNNETKYLYIGQDDVGCMEKDRITELRVLGIGKGAEIGAAVAIELDGTPYVPIHDKIGNVTTLLDLMGEVIASYRYSAFGEEVIDNDASVKNPWRFSSKRHDPETGLVYFGRRYYDPTIGRWITTDPAGYDAGPNLYAYVKNNPTTHIDLYGLMHRSDEDFYVHQKMRENCERSRQRSREESGNKGGSSIDYDHDRGDFNNDREPPWFVTAVEFLLALPGHIVEIIGEHLVPVPVIRDVISWTGRLISGQGIDWNPSYSRPRSENFSLEGEHRVIPNVSIIASCGMMNPRPDATDSAGMVSTSLNNAAVRVAWGDTKGLFSDIAECIVLWLGCSTYTSRKLGEEIRDQLEAIGPDGLLVLYLHSRSALEYDVASKNLTAEQKSQIFVVTFGGAKMVERESHFGAVNFVSEHDIVPFIADTLGYLKAKHNGSDSNVMFLKSDTFPFVDHAFAGKTYQGALRSFGAKIQDDIYGELSLR